MTVLRLANERTRNQKRQWVCRCRCGATVTRIGAGLLSGSTRSCGCLRRENRGPLTRKEMVSANREVEVQHDSGREWYAPRLATAVLGIVHHTLTAWRVSCPWLKGGRGLTSKRLHGAKRRLVPYYLKDDLDEVAAARGQRELIPAEPGHLHTREAAAAAGCHPTTLRKWMKRRGKKYKPVSAKGTDGVPRRRYYVAQSAVDEYKRDKARDHKQPDRATVYEIATAYGRTPECVRSWYRRGHVRSYRGTTRTDRLGVRKCVLLSRTEVERFLKAGETVASNGIPAPASHEATDTTTTAAAETPFVPTRFQVCILEALKYKFHTADQLQAELRCDRARLFYDGKKRRGLAELSQRDYVRNLRGYGRGYYSVEFPPPEIASFLGENRHS